MQRLFDASDPDIAGRFRGIEAAWRDTQLTGYGEAVSLIARHAYGLDELTADGLAAAQGRTAELRRTRGALPAAPRRGQPRPRADRRLLLAVHAGRLRARLLPVRPVLVQLLLRRHRLPRPSTRRPASRSPICRRSGAPWRRSSPGTAPCAIAVKAQHAYARTLNWTERSDADAAVALDAILGRPKAQVDLDTWLCLGDWCWARGVELTIEHDLPFKIHTGYYAGNDRMPVEFIPAGNMCALFARYLDAKFVLMHIAYPYCDELVALAKHYRNIWVDLCWAWSIDPYSSRDFVRRFIHAAPINKLFAFGGDTGWPTSAMAYAMQARGGIRAALEAEVAAGDLTEKQAMQVASRIMRDNQYAASTWKGPARTSATRRSSEQLRRPASGREMVLCSLVCQ